MSDRPTAIVVHRKLSIDYAWEVFEQNACWFHAVVWSLLTHVFLACRKDARSSFFLSTFLAQKLLSRLVTFSLNHAAYQSNKKQHIHPKNTLLSPSLSPSLSLSLSLFLSFFLSKSVCREFFDKCTLSQNKHGFRKSFSILSLLSRTC